MTSPAPLPHSPLEDRLPPSMRERIEPLESPNPDTLPTLDVTSSGLLDDTGNPVLTQDWTVTPLTVAQAMEIVHSRRALWEGQDADQQPFDEHPKHWSIRDNSRHYAFEGIRLAYVSSEKSYKSRWTEISVYRSVGGLFLTHRVGVSAVAHAYGCEVLTNYRRRYAVGIDGIASDELGIKDRVPCEVCKPDLPVLLHSDPASILYERDRHSAAIFDNPGALCASLEALDDRRTSVEGNRNRRSLAASALQIAADRDPLIAAVLYAPRETQDRPSTPPQQTRNLQD